MKILNPQVSRDLDQGKSIKLDLGSGGPGRAGFYAVDHLALEGVDIIADLNQRFDLLPDNCVSHIYSRHALEHVDRLLPLMNELHRLTRADGRIEIVVPHFSNVYGFSDPTHVRFFGLYSMYYFVARENQPSIRKVPSFYTNARFRIDKLTIEFYRSGAIDKLIAPLLGRLINQSIHLQDFYERRLSGLFHAWQIRYLMRPEK